MAMRFMIVLAVMLVSIAAAAQEKSEPPQPADAKKPNPSDVVKNTKPGKLPRKSEVDYLETRLQQLLRKIDPNMTGREAVPYKLEQARKGLAQMDELHGGWTIQQNEAPDWWQAIPHNGPKDKWRDSWNYWPTLDYSPEAKSLMHKWIPKYKKYLNEKFGIQTTLSSKQLEAQVWTWLVPREKAELKAKINKLEKEYARDLESIRDIRSRLAKKKAEIKRTKTALPDTPSKGGNPENGKPQSDKLVSNRPQIENSLPPRKPNNYLVDDALNRTEIISDGDEKSITNCQPPAKGGAGKSGCSAMVLPFNRDACLAYQQHQTDVCAGITDPRQAPIQQECWKLLKSGLANLQTRNTECGCDRRCHEALAKDLRATLKILKISLAEAKEEKNCKSGGGLVGAVDCVDRRIEGAGSESKKTPASAASMDERTGVKTTSVRNPDGTRTVTKTDKDGNVLSRETVDKGPASASSTDRATGITTTSVRNSDGTRTVTRIDKDGNVLSKQIVGKSLSSASATEKTTGATTTSVANPDGSRTVTKTDAQGNILSEEKVR